MYEPIYLVEIDAHNGSEVVTLRYATDGYRTRPSDTPASTRYDPVLIDPGSFERSLFGGRKTIGLGQINHGSVELANPDGGLDAIKDYGVDGRRVRILRLANVRDAYSTAVVVLRTTAQRFDADAALGRLRLRLYDRRLELDEPLQENRYTGETIGGGISGHLADGNADMKDRPKPLIFGIGENMAPVCVNQYDLIWQVHDGAVEAITVYDGRAPLTLTQDHATVALLQAAAIPPGKYGTCLAEGLFRLGLAPWFTLTADVTQGATSADRTAAGIVEAMLAMMGLTGSDNIDAANFAAFASLCDQELGFVVNGDQRASEAIGQVLASVGGYLLPSAAGPFQVGRGPEIGTPTWTLDENTILEGEFSIVANPDTPQGLPAWRVILQWGRNWTVQTGEMMCPGISAALKSFAETEWREVKEDDASVLTKYQLAGELTVESFITGVDDAADEAARLAGLHEVFRDTLVVSVALEDADDMQPATTGTLVLPRFGWDAGKNFYVIAREDELSAGRAILTLWG